MTPELIATDGVSFGQTALEGDDAYWLETRPNEGGRGVVVRRKAGGEVSDVTPQGYNVRTRVHEYGGGSFAVAEGVVYFSNFEDQRLYRQDPGKEPRPLTPDGEKRYADGDVDRRRGRLVCIREDHTVAGREAVNTLVSVDLAQGGPGDLLVSGSDFYCSPRISRDGSRLAWLSWDHPNMPWDGTSLWTAPLDDAGRLGEATFVAGGEHESIFQPEWSPDGALYFVSDRTGWWNIYRWRNDEIEQLCEMEAEFGIPQWGLGVRTYGLVSAERIICAYNKSGVWSIADLNTESKTLQRVPHRSLTSRGLAWWYLTRESCLGRDRPPCRRR